MRKKKVHKKKKAGFKKGSMSQGELSPVQKEILDFYVYQNLSVKQIANRRGVSTRAIYKTLTKIREKGFATKGFKNRGSQTGGHYSTPRHFTSKGRNKRYRLHAQRFKILAPQGGKYEKAKERSDVIPIKGNRILLHATNIEVTARKDLSFYGDTPDEALNASMEYWDWIFSLLENDLGFYVVKDRQHAIKRTVAHYAKMDDRMAEKGIDEENIYRIKTSEDGKSWLIFDRSKGPAERETIHSGTAHDDSEWLDELLNDVRDDYHHSREVPKISEIKMVLQELAQETKKIAAENTETAAGLSVVVDLMKPPKVKPQKGKFTKPDYVG